MGAFGNSTEAPKQPGPDETKPKMVGGASDPKGWEEQKAFAYWKDYVSRAEAYEGRIISELKSIFSGQKN